MVTAGVDWVCRPATSRGARLKFRGSKTAPSHHAANMVRRKTSEFNPSEATRSPVPTPERANAPARRRTLSVKWA